MVYFIQAIDGGPIKIGTTIRLSERLATLSREFGKELRVLAVTDGSYELEKSLHRRFAHLNVVNELFEPADDLLGFIIEHGREWDGRDEPGCATAIVRIDAEVLKDLKIAAAFKDRSITELLSDIVRPVVKKIADEEANRRAQSAEPKKPR